MPYSQTLDLKQSTAQLINSDIAYLRIHSDALMDVEDLKEAFDAYETLSKGKPIKMLIEFGEYATHTSAGRKWGQENNPSAIAEAIVIKNLGQRILTNFYFKFHHKDHPKTVFKSKENAIAWLESM